MFLFGRVKKLVPCIRAFLPRARTFLRRNRYGLTTIKQAPTVIWAQKAKIAKLVVLTLVVAVLLTASNFYPALDSAPAVSTEWILPWLAGHHIGEPIEATLRITSPVALFVDPDSLRQEGETLGNFEVRERGGPYISYVKEEAEIVKVTEFHYVLQYLKPLGDEVFTERALPRTYFDYHYLRRYDSRVYWIKGKTHAGKAELYLTKRVQPGDAPFPLAGEVPEGRRFGWIMKAVGIAVVLAVPAFHLTRFITGRLRARRIKRRIEKEVRQRLSDLFWELQKLWQETGNYRYFLEATVLARDRRKKQLGLREGELLPRDVFWEITTKVLYSGGRLETAEVSDVFELLANIFKEDDDAV